MDTPTPRTNALLARRRDAALEEWSTEDVMELLAHCRDLERESLAKDAQIVALRSALEGIESDARDLRRFKKFTESVESLACSILLKIKGVAP